MAENDDIVDRQLLVNIQKTPPPPPVPLLKRITSMLGKFLLLFLIAFCLAIGFRQLTEKNSKSNDSMKDTIDYMSMKLRPVTHLPTGTEYYCEETGDWYWMETSKGSEFAHDCEVFIPYIYNEEIASSTEGKWVRYDHEGKMIKGWYAENGNEYYYDPVTGAMYKGQYMIDGRMCRFDDMTGILQSTTEISGIIQ